MEYNRTYPYEVEVHSLHNLQEALSLLMEALALEVQGDRILSFDAYSNANLLVRSVVPDNVDVGECPLVVDLCRSILDIYNNKVQACASAQCLNNSEESSKFEMSSPPRTQSPQVAPSRALISAVGDDTTVGLASLPTVMKRKCHGSLDDIAGLWQVKAELWDSLIFPLHHPELFTGLRQPHKNFLLHGPPGTGKTLLVTTTAAEGGMALMRVTPAEVLSKWSGESEKAIHRIFNMAKEVAPCIIFIDEIDSLGRQRGCSDDALGRRVLTQLLLAMNDVVDSPGVRVVAATNRLEDCDPALLRRFDRRIEVPLPDEGDRRAIFLKLLGRPEMTHQLSGDEISQLVEVTAGYSGSDLMCLCKEAAMGPVRDVMAPYKRKRGWEQRTQEETPRGGGESLSQGLRSICMADFNRALVKVLPPVR